MLSAAGIIVAVLHFKNVFGVWICMVKVRFACLALAHVSHFFAEPEPWAYKQSTPFFPNDLRCGFRKLKEQGVGNRASGAVLVPKSLLLLLLFRTPTPAGTRFYLHKEF